MRNYKDNCYATFEKLQFEIADRYDSYCYFTEEKRKARERKLKTMNNLAEHKNFKAPKGNSSVG